MNICIEAGSISLNLKKRRQETILFIEHLYENLSFFTNDEILMSADNIFLECSITLAKSDFLNKIQRLALFLYDSDLIQDFNILVTDSDFDSAIRIMHQCTELNLVYFTHDNYLSYREFLSFKGKALINGDNYYKVKIRTELIEHRSSFFFRLAELSTAVKNYDFNNPYILSVKYSFLLHTLAEKVFKEEIVSIDFEALNDNRFLKKNTIYLCAVDFSDEKLMKSVKSSSVIFYTKRLLDQYVAISDIRDFSPDEIIFIYRYLLSRQILPDSVVREYFSEVYDTAGNLFSNGINILTETGLLTNLKYDETFQTFCNDVNAAFPEQASSTGKDLGRFIYEKTVVENVLTNYQEILKFINNYFEGTDKFYYTLKILQKIYEADLNRDAIQKVLNNYYTLVKYKNEQERKLADCVLFVTEMNYALVTGDEISCAIAYEKLKNVENLENTLIEIYVLLAKAGFAAAYCNYKEAMDIARKALYLAGEIDSDELKAEAEIYMSAAKLGMQDLNESMQYIDHSFKHAKECISPCVFLDAVFYKTLVLFLRFELEDALEVLEITDSEVSSSLHYHNVLNFLKGRIYFELGRYSEAEEIFNKCAIFSANSDSEQKVCRAWEYRCEVYRKEKNCDFSVKRKIEALGDLPDAKLVMAEYFYFRGKVKRAAEEAEQAFIHYSNDFTVKFLPVRYFSLRTGFFIFEDRIFKDENGNGTLGLYLNFFRYMLDNSFEFNPSKIISSITRQKMKNMNPHSRFYLIMASEALKNRGSEDSLNRITILNRSNKLVKDLSTLIRDPAMKREFMRKNYWNSVILEQAQQMNIQ